MKLVELKNDESKILLQTMYNLTEFCPRQTGIPFVMSFGEINGQFGPMLKIANIKNKIMMEDSFVISIKKEPTILTPKSVKLEQNEINDIKRWIKQNYDDLMLLWKIDQTSNSIVKDKTGEDVHLYDIIDRLKKI